MVTSDLTTAAIDQADPSKLTLNEFPFTIYSEVRGIDSATGEFHLKPDDLTEVAEETAGLRKFILLWVAATAYWRIKNHTDFSLTVKSMEVLLEERFDEDVSRGQLDAARCYLLTLQAQHRALSHHAGYGVAREEAETACRESEDFYSRTDCRGPLLGALNFYASLVLLDIERAGEQFSLKDGRASDEVTLALKRINTAISMSGGRYAKYYSTKAQLLCVVGQFEPAREAILGAMEREDGDGPDFEIRMVEYTAVRERIATIQAISGVWKDARRAQEELEGSEARLIQVVGLLSGIVALVVSGGVAGGSSEDPVMASTIVLSLTLAVGALLLLFNSITSKNMPWSRLFLSAVVFGGTILGVGALAKAILA
jgi:hypothetical protein